MVAIKNPFRPPDFYTDEVPEFLKEDKGLNRLFIITFSFVSILHLFSDYKFFGMVPKFYHLAALRAFFIFMTAATFIALEKIRKYEHYSAVLFFWLIASLAFIFLIDMTRPKTYLTGISVDTLLMFCFFIFLRLRLLLQITAAVLFSCSIFYHLYFLKDIYLTQIYFSFGTTIIIVFVVGIYFSMQIRNYRTRLIGDKIYEKNLKNKLRNLADMDPLSGIYNRRKIHEILEKEIERKRRYGRPLSLIILDIDHFKLINDKYGHDAGDLVIKKIPSVIQNQLRATDCMGRIGGDEFLIVLPDSSLNDTITLSDRIKTVLHSGTIESALPDISLTASMGLAELRDKEESMESLLKRADLNLYEAKRAGRDGYKY